MRMYISRWLLETITEAEGVLGIETVAYKHGETRQIPVIIHTRSVRWPLEHGS